MRNQTALSRLIRPTLFCLLALVCVSLGTAGERLCEGCKKPIGNSRWVEADGKHYHPDHFVCGNCQKQIRIEQFFRDKGEYYDSVCYANTIAPTCGYCSKPILTAWFGDDTTVYHATCFHEYVAGNCVVCNRPITDEYFYDDFGNYICSEHKAEVERCFFCQRYLSADPDRPVTRRPDGRLACFQCNQTAVVEIETAESILEEVRKQLETKGISIEENIDLSLVSQDELDAHGKWYMIEPLGYTSYKTRTHVPGVISHKIWNIRILHGLPLTQYRHMVAHELMHVWLGQNGPSAAEPMLKEGSCDYASYILLLDDHSDEAQRLRDRLLKTPNPVYGEGLRRVVGMVSQHGVQGWLDYLKSNSEFPK